MAQSGPAIGGDEVNALVLDVGTYQVKAGYAGEDTPKFVFPSAVGVMRDSMDVDGSASGKYLVGAHAVSTRRDGMEIVSAFDENGLVSDMDVLESLWSYTLKDQMRANASEHPIMLSEPTHTNKKAREKAVELIFEKFGVPAVFLAKSAVLSSFAMGRQTSLVVDCGHDGTTVAAVHDGYVLNKSITRLPIGGAQLTTLLRQSIESKGTVINPRYAFKRIDKGGGRFETEYTNPGNTTDSFREYSLNAIAAEIKHTICRVSDAPFDPEENANIPTVMYELPDGQEISVGAPRFSVPEVFFNPSLLSGFGSEGRAIIQNAGSVDALPSLHAAINDVIGRMDVDIRRELYGGVLLSGGTSMFGSLRDRLERELTEVAPQMARVKVVSPTNAVERRFSTWIGGSILASLGTFQQMWMSKSEYQELGAGLIHKKAP